MENTKMAPQNNHGIIIYSSNYTSGYTPPKKWKQEVKEIFVYPWLPIKPKSSKGHCFQIIFHSHAFDGCLAFYVIIQISTNCFSFGYLLKFDCGDIFYCFSFYKYFTPIPTEGSKGDSFFPPEQIIFVLKSLGYAVDFAILVPSFWIL